MLPRGIHHPLKKSELIPTLPEVLLKAMRSDKSSDATEGSGPFAVMAVFAVAALTGVVKFRRKTIFPVGLGKVQANEA